MKSGVVIKVALQDIHLLVIGQAIHFRINLGEPHLSLPLVMWSMMTM